MLEAWRSGAPRLRRAALIVVGLAVVALVAYSCIRADETVRATVLPSGEICVQRGDRTWTSAGPVFDPSDDATTIEGTWTSTGPESAVLTTASGRTFDLDTSAWSGDRSCVLAGA